MGPSFNFDHTYIPGGTNTDRSYSLGYQFEFNNASFFEVSFNHVYQRLTNSFDLLDPDEFTGFVEGEEYIGTPFPLNTEVIPERNFSIESIVVMVVSTMAKISM
jgi:hypothetical protein